MGDIEDCDGECRGRVEKWITSFIDVPGQISIVVYLRGCSLKCEDCQNCALQDGAEGGTVYRAAELADLLNTRKLPDWVCFQGGEPLDQSNFVQAVIARLHPHFRVAIYTGYIKRVVVNRHQNLLDMPRVLMLKAGQFMKRKRIYDKFLATTNQELFVKRAADRRWERIAWFAGDGGRLSEIFADLT